MDRFSTTYLNRLLSKDNNKTTPQQTLTTKPSIKFINPMTPQARQKGYDGLVKQFDNFKNTFMKKPADEEPTLKNTNKLISMTTPNLLSVSQELSTANGNKHKLNIGKNRQETHSKKISPSLNQKMQENTKRPNLDKLKSNLQQKLIQCFNVNISPMLQKIYKMHNTVSRLEELTSRLKYIYRKKHSKLKFNIKNSSIQASCILDRNRTNSRCITQHTSNKQITQPKSRDYSQSKLILEGSIRSLLQHEKQAYQTLTKKDKLIDLLAQQICELQQRKQYDIEMLKQQIVAEEERNNNKNGELNKKILQMKSILQSKQYLIENLQLENQQIHNKCKQLQVQTVSLQQKNMKSINENKSLRQKIAQLEELVRVMNDNTTNEIQTIRQRAYSIAEKLEIKEEELSLQKHESSQQYKLMEKELRDIEQGYIKTKTSNQIYKTKLSQSQKEIAKLKKQLVQSGGTTKEQIRKYQGGTLEKDKIDIQIYSMKTRIAELQTLLEQSEFSRIKLLKEHTQKPNGKYSEEMLISLKQYIFKLQKEIIEKDRRIWLLESNIIRIKEFKKQLPILFSPKSSSKQVPSSYKKLGNEYENTKQVSPRHQNLVGIPAVSAFCFQEYF